MPPSTGAAWRGDVRAPVSTASGRLAALPLLLAAGLASCVCGSADPGGAVGCVGVLALQPIVRVQHITHELYTHQCVFRGLSMKQQGVVLCETQVRQVNEGIAECLLGMYIYGQALCKYCLLREISMPQPLM